MEALADDGYARSRGARDCGPRLGLICGHTAGGRGGSLEPEGLREQRPPASADTGRLARRLEHEDFDKPIGIEHDLTVVAGDLALEDVLDSSDQLGGDHRLETKPVIADGFVLASPD